MKKKLLSLLMVLALVLGNVAVVSAAEAADAPTVSDSDLTAVTGAEAIAAIGTENTIFLDLRAAVDYAAGHIKGSVSAPVCLSADEGYAVPVTNKEAFIAQMQELQAKYQNANGSIVLNGRHDPKTVQKSIYEFIEKFVLCPKCTIPETTLSK